MLCLNILLLLLTSAPIGICLVQRRSRIESVFCRVLFSCIKLLCHYIYDGLMRL